MPTEQDLQGENEGQNEQDSQYGNQDVPMYDEVAFAATGPTAEITPNNYNNTEEYYQGGVLEGYHSRDIASRTGGLPWGPGSYAFDRWKKPEDYWPHPKPGAYYINEYLNDNPGEHKIKCNIKEKDYYIKFNDANPHKFTISVGEMSETFEFKCSNRRDIADLYNKSNPGEKLSASDINKFSLSLFYNKQTKILISTKDSVEIRSWTFDKLKVLEILKTFAENTTLIIDIVGNAAIEKLKDSAGNETGEYDFVDYTPKNDFKGFTKKRAENVRNSYFNKPSSGIYIYSIEDVWNDETNKPDPSYKDVSAPNTDATGIQFYLREVKEGKPKFSN